MFMKGFSFTVDFLILIKTTASCGNEPSILYIILHGHESTLTMDLDYEKLSRAISRTYTVHGTGYKIPGNGL
jgi:hypothetical protein